MEDLSQNIDLSQAKTMHCEECENCPGGCPSCELPDGGGQEEPPVECLVHSWSYCSSAWDPVNFGSVDAFAQQFSGLTNITFVDPTLPDYISGGCCENINSTSFWQALGEPQIGDSLPAHYFSQSSDPSLYYNWVCFTYQGLVSTTIQQTVVNMTLYPPYNQGDFVAWGTVLSGGTPFENCCECVDYTTPECQSACTPGCRISTATNYSNNDYCDCSGVWMGNDNSCCTFIPPCSAGCTDILATNYNGNATCDCGGVPGGTDYSCCLSSCDICSTNNINGAWNVGLLNAAPFGWAGGYFDNTFQFYYENDTTTYNGCCYLCHKSNVGPYFECSDFVTYGAPDTNPAWLSCCPNACDVECFSGCTQTIPSPSLTGNCAGTTFGTTVTGPWDSSTIPIGNPTDSSVMDYFINLGNGNQNTIIPGITFEVPRTLLANNFNLDCNGCNGPSTSDGSTVLWQVIGIAVQGQTGNINAWTSWNDLTSSPENTWDLIRTYINSNNPGFNITSAMDYNQVLALPYINDININVAPCMGCS